MVLILLRILFVTFRISNSFKENTMQMLLKMSRNKLWLLISSLREKFHKLFVLLLSSLPMPNSPKTGPVWCQDWSSTRIRTHPQSTLCCYWSKTSPTSTDIWAEVIHFTSKSSWYAIRFTTSCWRWQRISFSRNRWRRKHCTFWRRWWTSFTTWTTKTCTQSLRTTWTTGWQYWRK